VHCFILRTVATHELHSRSGSYPRTTELTLDNTKSKTLGKGVFESRPRREWMASPHPKWRRRHD